MQTKKQDSASRKRLAKAGYKVAKTNPLKRIHCTQDVTTFLENGFVQCFTKVAGKACRVMDYAPG